MAQAITMPQFGQTVEECTIVEWRKKEGDKVVKGDILFEIETDKAVLEVESFFEGTLLKILVPEGETVSVQTVVGFIGEPGEAIPEVEAPAPKALAEPAPAPETPSRAPSVAPAVPAREAPAAPPLPEKPTRFAISPRAAKLAREKVIDPTRIRGTGPQGRVVERDVIACLEERGYDRLRITPAAKALASKEELDLLSIEATGDGGKIVVADVKRAVAEKPKPMSKIRRVIAQRLTGSFTTTPHFFTTVSVDLTDLLAFRAECKKRGTSYTVTDFILKAAVLALEEFPPVNSSTDGKSVSWHSHVHLGLAVALDKGLVVPAIRCAEDLTLAQLHEEAVRLTEKARAGTLRPEEMTGSTFTVSNMGMMDVENFTAIINPGESAVLAISSAVKTPVVRDDAVVVRTMMKMTLSSDHRIIDGITAARFINAIKNKLEDIKLWKSTI
jgi:pyruvate dehydrogenase E2 component (dihydrolipoamide acetyltransferase)